MKKRLRKKLHKRFVKDVMIEVSCSDEWRAKLFTAEFGSKLIVDIQQFIPNHIRNDVYRHNLQFWASKVTCIDVKKDVLIDLTGACSCDENWSFFKIEAIEFPEIVDYSLNY